MFAARKHSTGRALETRFRELKALRVRGPQISSSNIMRLVDAEDNERSNIGKVLSALLFTWSLS